MEWFSKENRFPRDLYVHVYASLGVGTEEIYYIQAGRMLYPRMCNENAYVANIYKHPK